MLPPSLSLILRNYSFLMALSKVTFTAGMLPFVVLMTFYVTATKFTKYGKERKMKLEYQHEQAAQRTVIQVLSNSLGGSIACLVYSWSTSWAEVAIDVTANPLPSMALIYFLAHNCCCAGDTWSSELGILAKGRPFLVTSCKRVPPGTNGAVSLVGLVASLAAGLLIGLIAVIFCTWNAEPTTPSQMWIIVACGCAGLGGSLIDSLLGATVQYSGYSEKEAVVISDSSFKGLRHVAGVDILDNHQVNMLSGNLTAALTCVIVYFLHQG